MKSFRLAVVYGPETGKSFPLGEMTRLGRDSESEVHISDSRISRQHAVIEFQENVYTIRDLDSTNGTFVNGLRITEATPLKVGDSISIGSWRFLVLSD